MRAGPVRLAYFLWGIWEVWREKANMEKAGCWMLNDRCRMLDVWRKKEKGARDEGKVRIGFVSCRKSGTGIVSVLTTSSEHGEYFAIPNFVGDKIYREQDTDKGRIPDAGSREQE